MEDDQAPRATEVEFTGTLRHEAALEGGTWLVDVDEDAPAAVHEAVGPVAQLGAELPAGTGAALDDGAHVRVRARTAPASASIFMAGTPLEGASLAPAR